MSVTRRERTVPTTERLLEIKGHWVLRLAFRSRALRRVIFGYWGGDNGSGAGAKPSSPIS